MSDLIGIYNMFMSFAEEGRYVLYFSIPLIILVAFFIFLLLFSFKVKREHKEFEEVLKLNQEVLKLNQEILEEKKEMFEKNSNHIKKFEKTLQDIKEERYKLEKANLEKRIIDLEYRLNEENRHHHKL